MLVEPGAQHSWAARALEREWRSLSSLEQPLHCVGLLRLDGTALEVDPCALERTGWSEDAVLGQPVWALPWWVTPAPARAQLEAAVAQAACGDTVHLELELRDRDQAALTVEFSIRGQRNGAGRVVALVAEARNISERARLAATLRETERRCHTAFDLASIGMALVAPDGRWLKVNRALCGFLGYSEAELLASNFQAITHPDDLEQDLRQSARLLRGEIPSLRFEKRYRHRDGRFVWALLSVAVERDEEGQPLHYITSIQDISERKQAEEALREGERLYRTLVESIDGVVWEAHAPDFGNVFVSRQAGSLLGYPSAEWMASRSFWEDHLHPDDRQRAMREAETGLQEGRPYRSEYRMIASDGRTVWIHDVVSVVLEDDHVGRLRGVMFDVTARKQAEHESQAQRDLALQVMNTMGQGLLVLDAEQRFEFVNPALARMLGARAEDLIGLTPADVIAAEDWNELEARLRAGAYPEAGTHELRLRRADAGQVHALVTWAPRPGDGDPTGSIVVVTDLTERRAVEAQLEHQAYHDALTGLPNRQLFNRRLEQALEQARGQNGALAVAFLDLDRFKLINDTLGHAVGDQLLEEVARRLRACLRNDDTVARMGGDEFTLILPGVRNRASIARVAQKVLAALAAPFELEGHELHVTASIGLSSYPYDGNDAGTLLKNADTAMYCAKDAGISNYRIFTPAMSQESLERLDLETDLRRALERDELRLLYQPQFDLQDGALIGLEALLRWQHPTLGLVPPGKFIPIAEDSGLIVPIGTWVLREACRQNAEWQRQGMGPVRIAVNVSALQFGRPDFVQIVAGALEANQLEARWLELELTESLVMRDLTASAEQMTRLRALGVSISVDDFGTGYSSLSYLRHLPISSLKIDRSFINEIGETASTLSLVRAVIALAQGLGLEALAEGVETEQQLEALRGLGCDRAQGYLFARPLPPEELPARVLCRTATQPSPSPAEPDPAVLAPDGT